MAPHTGALVIGGAKGWLNGRRITFPKGGAAPQGLSNDLELDSCPMNLRFRASILRFPMGSRVPS